MEEEQWCSFLQYRTASSTVPFQPTCSTVPPVKQYHFNLTVVSYHQLNITILSYLKVIPSVQQYHFKPTVVSYRQLNSTVLLYLLQRTAISTVGIIIIFPLSPHSCFNCHVKPTFLSYFDVFSTVHHSIGLFLQPTLMHNSITHVCHITILDMFRALTCPSSGGTTAQTQHLVSSLF